MAEVYDTTRFGELYYASIEPSSESLGLAGKYITELLTSFQIPFAIIGGWAIFLRGSQRQTRDVDIAVGTTMEYLKSILLEQSRVFFPANHGQTCVQIFVKTGQSYDQNYKNTLDVNVSMDLVISGNLGTPVDLSASCDLIHTAAVTPQGDSALVLGLYHQMCAKLAAFVTRGNSSNSSNDSNDFLDLVFLVGAYGNYISLYKNYLDAGHCRGFVAKFASLNAGDDETIKYVKDIFGVP